MNGPLLYRSNLPPVGTSCGICGATERLVNDHCHAHGWVRGALCPSCNQVMRYADIGLISRTYQRRKGSPVALSDHRARCADCTPLPLEPLTVPIPRTPAKPDRAKVLALLDPPSNPLPAPAERARLRKAHGLTLEQIATAIGVTRHAVSGWERGLYLPKGDARVQYAELLRLIAERHPAPDGGGAP